MAEPVAGERVRALDVIRGVAILGTFATNVWIFTEPGGAAALFSTGFTPGGPLESLLRGIANGKFLALLTLLFGIGLELQYRAALRRGLRWPGRYLRRAGILILEGFLHYLLIFEFDVLMGYGIASIAVAYLIGRSDAVQRRWMAGVGAVYLVLVLALSVLSALAPQATAPAPEFGTGSWPAQVAVRVFAFPLFRSELLLIVPSSIVLFLVGARLLRAGVFTASTAGARLRARLMAFGFGLGVPLHVFTTLAGADGFLPERYLLGPLIALGLLALITELVLRVPRPGPLRGGLTAVGRTALSCYVLQNLLAVVLCYDWGLGLNSRLAGLGPWWPVLLWCGVCAVNTALATLWLRRFDRGPLELVAHRLAGAADRPIGTPVR